jgi:lipopolysaccharide export system protein LptA
MKRSEAAKYARWSAAVALVLAAGTAGVYVQRGWKARTERRNAPAAAAANILRQSNGVTFSKGEGSRKEFTVEASKSTDFKDRDLTELETVVITIFGKNGDRHDVIHTKSCQYGKADGNVVCSGEVRMDLESAADAERTRNAAAGPVSQGPQSQVPVPQVMHVVTKAVTFNQKSGTASTGEPVSFSFPNGSGQGVGLEYKSEAGTVRLLRQVRLKLRPPPSPAVSARGKAKPAPAAASDEAADADPDKEVTVTGRNLDFDRVAHRMHVQGPATAESKTTRLTAGELTLDLDAQFRAQTLLASGEVNDEQPKIVSQTSDAQVEVHGDHLSAEFSPQGWVTGVAAEGHVKGVRRTDDEGDDSRSETATIAMWPRVNEVKELVLRGDVTLKSLVTLSGDSRLLRTEALRMEFSGGKENAASKPVKAETLTVGRMEWSETNATSITGTKAANASGTAKNKVDGVNAADATRPATPAHTTLTADKLQMLFDALGKPKQLLADGHVRTDRTMAEKPTQTATAQSGVANLLPTGGWSQMDLNGAVKLREGDRNGQSDHAVFRQAEQTATLTGHAIVRDATTETAASRIVFVQNTGDIHAEGGVRSTDLPVSNGPASNGTAQSAPVPTHITADLLQGNSQTGRALYTGHARMWQGESVLEADSIELLRPTQVMNALGNIRAVFPQAAATTPAVTGDVGAARAVAPAVKPAVATPTTTAGSKTAVTTGPDTAKKSPLWHVTAQSLMYNDSESHAHLEHDVIAQSVDQKMRAPIVDLYFTRGTNLTTAATPSVPGHADGPQQISRAVGTGGTTVEEGGRKAVAERGVYTAADGKFVMSGGHPTLYDGTEGNTSGRQLTFFLSDDTIIVDSENGSRILTRHRVE